MQKESFASFLDDPRAARARTSLAYRTRKFVGRNRLAVAATVVVLATLLAGIVFTSIGFVRANRRKQAADQEAQDVRTLIL